MKKIKEDYFTFDDETYYKGYHFPDITWNGFAVPYFTKEVANKIAENTDPNFFKIKYNKKKDCFYEIDMTFYDKDIDKSEYTKEFDKTFININGKEKTLYSIGGYEWSWTIKEQKKDIEEEIDMRI